MSTTKISILSTLFIFAIVTQAWSDPDKSMNAAANRVTTMKMDENKDALQKKKRPAQKPANSIRKGDSKSQSALRCPDDGGAIATKKEMYFLKAVEEKSKTRWIDLDQMLYSPEFLRRTCKNDSLTWRESPATKSSNTDFNQSISRPFPAGGKYLEGGTKLEILRHLESKKEEILRGIFMGLRFSFTPTSRHMVLEMNVSPSYERGPGLIIPF